MSLDRHYCLRNIFGSVEDEQVLHGADNEIKKMKEKQKADRDPVWSHQGVVVQHWIFQVTN